MKIARHSNHISYVVKILVLSLVYFLAARIGFLFPFEGEIATLIWLASGISLVALLFLGLDMWPAITLGSLLVAISNGHSISLTIGVVIAHTLEPFLGAYILRKYTSFDTKLENFSDVYYLLIFAILLAPAISATIGILSFAISPEGTGSNFQLMWWHWWIAHAISLAAIVPLILTWSSERPRITFNIRFFEFLLVLGLLLLVSILVFIRIDRLPIGNFPLGHVVFPFLFWIALRFSPREVALAGFMTVFMSIIGTIQNTGPFSRPDLNFNLVLLGTFVFSVVVIMLMLSSIFAQRQRTRQELQSSHNELEKRVSARTQELNTVNSKLQIEVEERIKIAEALQEARDNAVVALDYKNQILANVSHDARTPLNIIMLNADLIQRKQDNLTEKQLSRLNIIDISCQDLLIFINNLLDAAKIQSNEVKPEFAAINLQEFLDKNLSKYRELANNKNLVLEMEMDESMPSEILSDVDWLNKIIANLLTNAIKFTHEGSIKLSVTTSNYNYWQLSIQDTGIGIPKNALDHIFQSFWQVDGSTVRQANRGVGLGLSIVNRFVKLLNGAITVESEVGQGTTFVLDFPLKVSELHNA